MLIPTKLLPLVLQIKLAVSVVMDFSSFNSTVRTHSTISNNILFYFILLTTNDGGEMMIKKKTKTTLMIVYHSYRLTL